MNETTTVGMTQVSFDFFFTQDQEHNCFHGMKSSVVKKEQENLSEWMKTAKNILSSWMKFSVIQKEKEMEFGFNHVWIATYVNANPFYSLLSTPTQRSVCVVEKTWMENLLIAG